MGDQERPLVTEATNGRSEKKHLFLLISFFFQVRPPLPFIFVSFSSDLSPSRSFRSFFLMIFSFFFPFYSSPSFYSRFRFFDIPPPHPRFIRFFLHFFFFFFFFFFIFFFVFLVFDSVRDGNRSASFFALGFPLDDGAEAGCCFYF